MDTSYIAATLHVTSIEGSSSLRPGPERVQQAAEALRELGFEVVRAGRFGVRVRADARRFQEALGVPLTAADSGSMPISQPNASLVGLIDLVEVLPEPKS